MFQELPKSFFLHALFLATAWLILIFYVELPFARPGNSPLEVTILPVKLTPFNTPPIPLAKKILVKTKASPKTLASEKTKTPIVTPDTSLPDSSEAQNPTPSRLNNSFFVELRAALEALKEYPLLAKSRHQSGTVEVSFTLTKNGSFQDIKISHPSVFEKLNTAALLTVSRLDHFRPVPDEVSKTPLRLVIPIEFKLN